MDLRYVITYRDLAQRIIVRMGLGASDRELLQVKTAVVDAYRDLVNMHPWRHYTRQIYFRTSATQSFTVSYDHTGGSNERQLTITGAGSWPSDILDSDIRIGNEMYEVERSVSSTVITLSASSNPGADTTGSCTVSRARYMLPFPIRQVNEVWQADGNIRLVYVPVTDIGTETSIYDEESTPWSFTLQASRNTPGATELRLLPAPTESKNYQVTCEIRPWPLKTYEVSGADGAGSNGATTFTSAGASFRSDIVGSVIRLSSTSAKPGSSLESEANRTDAVFSSIIRKVTNATTLELVDPLPQAFSTCGYSISDMIDIEPASMLSYLESLTLEKFCLNHDFRRLATQKALAQEELVRAIAAESSINWNTRYHSSPFTFADETFFGRVDLSSLT